MTVIAEVPDRGLGAVSGEDGTSTAVSWGAIVAGIFLLHSGEVLLVLLAPYFGLFCLLQRWGMNVVREVTASPAATALFGAILFAGFCLVVFPTT